ncbi:MAG: glycoside hydrolase family 1 protein, partial [Bdellovibrio sp.]
NHWNLISEDIKNMKRLGLNSYRFSVEWAKIQPSPEKWDKDVLNHYKNLVKQLKDNGIEPLVTLHHFTLPNWLAQKGGWTSQDSVPAFTEYAAKVFEYLNEDVSTWVTFNEPMVVVTAGYLDGIFPPQKKQDFPSAFTALKNILTAHAQVVKKLRLLDIHKKSRFGFAHHLRVFDPINKLNPLDYLVRNQIDQIWNWAFTDALMTGRFKINIPFVYSIDVQIPDLSGSQDFFGLNYYTRDLVGFSFKSPYFKRANKEKAPVSDLGWEIYPQGLGILLSEIHTKYPSLPIIITENGIADSKDINRAEYISSHLKEVENALNRNIPVEGYCYWSLMDNFEWAEGFTPRFGLYQVDYVTFKRNQRKSSEYLKQIIVNKTALSQAVK